MMMPKIAPLGTVGALAGIIGSLQALEIIELPEAVTVWPARCGFFDGLAGHARVLNWPGIRPIRSTARRPR